MITQEFLRNNYTYSDGKLFQNTTGKSVGWPNGSGRIRMYIAKKLYYLHRMIWLYHYGELSSIVDHIDRNVSNNRIENLRLATAGQSSCNREFYNSSGFRGVDRFSKTRWRAKIRHNDKHIHLGYFNSAEEASKAYEAAALSIHKDFAVLTVSE